jgi:peptidoglycan lytic transglycosylase G
LPVGPICNPGKEALQAALHPTETKFLYFVSKNDGTHQFSASLSAHNRAVRKYQRKKKNKKVK